MKIGWGSRGTDGRLRLEAWAGPYDGQPPMNILFLESEPLYVHDDVLAVASALLFGQYSGGEFHLPRQVSPEVARAIEVYCQPAWIKVSPLNFEPRANPSGDGQLFLTDSLDDLIPRSSWGEPRISTLVSLPSSEFSGALISSNGLVVNSNASLLGKFRGPDAILSAHLAVSLLYAETFFAKRILISKDLLHGVSDEHFFSVQTLIQSCKISIAQAPSPQEHWD